MVWSIGSLGPKRPIYRFLKRRYGSAVCFEAFSGSRPPSEGLLQQAEIGGLVFFFFLFFFFLGGGELIKLPNCLLFGFEITNKVTNSKRGTTPSLIYFGLNFPFPEPEFGFLGKPIDRKPNHQSNGSWQLRATSSWAWFLFFRPGTLFGLVKKGNPNGSPKPCVYMYVCIYVCVYLWRGPQAIFVCFWWGGGDIQFEDAPKVEIEVLELRSEVELLDEQTERPMALEAQLRPSLECYWRFLFLTST